MIATACLILFLHKQHLFVASNERKNRDRRKVYLARRLKFVCRNINFFANQHTGDLIRVAEQLQGTHSRNPLGRDDYAILEEASDHFDCDLEQEALANLDEHINEHRNLLRSLETLVGDGSQPVSKIYENWNFLKSNIEDSQRRLTIASEQMHHLADRITPTPSDESGLPFDT